MRACAICCKGIVQKGSVYIIQTGRSQVKRAYILRIYIPHRLIGTRFGFSHAKSAVSPLFDRFVLKVSDVQQTHIVVIQLSACIRADAQVRETPAFSKTQLREFFSPFKVLPYFFANPLTNFHQSALQKYRNNR